jgi:hypothetical protein
MLSLLTGEEAKAGQSVQVVVANSELQIWPAENLPAIHKEHVLIPWTTSENVPGWHIRPSKTKPRLAVPILHGPTVTAIPVVRVPLTAVGTTQLRDVLETHWVDSHALLPILALCVKSVNPKSAPFSMTATLPLVGELPVFATNGSPTNSVLWTPLYTFSTIVLPASRRRIALGFF